MLHANHSQDWCRDVRETGVVRVAQAMGGATVLNEGRSGLTPCPACGDAVRGKSTRDRRGPVGITRDGLGWCCHRCGAKGDAMTLASQLFGAGGKVTREVHAACSRAGLLRMEGTATANSDRPGRTASQAPPRYPPEVEMRALTRELFAIDYAPDLAAMAWLRSRSLDAQLIADAGLCMSMLQNVPVPSWARCKGVPWSRSGHRLMVPLCDSQGRMRSLHARQIDTASVDMPKGTNPAGYDVRGLLLACPKTRTMLAGETRPEGVLITEGVPDWLTWFEHYHKLGKSIAVMGIVAGAWTEAFAKRLPNGSTVLLAGHQDTNGTRYMDQIVASLRPRVAAGHIAMRVRRGS